MSIEYEIEFICDECKSSATDFRFESHYCSDCYGALLKEIEDLKKQLADKE